MGKTPPGSQGRASTKPSSLPFEQAPFQWSGALFEQLLPHEPGGMVLPDPARGGLSPFPGLLPEGVGQPDFRPSGRPQPLTAQLVHRDCPPQTERSPLRKHGPQQQTAPLSQQVQLVEPPAVIRRPGGNDRPEAPPPAPVPSPPASSAECAFPPLCRPLSPFLICMQNLVTFSSLIFCENSASDLRTFVEVCIMYTHAIF